MVQGSPRNQHNCPGEWPKTTYLVQAIHKAIKGVEFDVLDLSVGFAQGDPTRNVVVQPCKGCVSTSPLHCAFPCTCWGPGTADEGVPDLMHDRHVYRRIQDADGFCVITPVHWYSVSSQVKAMFDRLVCANLTVTRTDALRIFGSIEAHKDPTRTKAAAASGEHDGKARNHLAGKVAAFLAHGDGGADDYVGRAQPLSYRRYGAASGEPPLSKALDPLVWQCRYSGVHVPEDLVETIEINRGVGYEGQNDRALRNQAFLDTAVSLVNRLITAIKVRT